MLPVDYDNSPLEMAEWSLIFDSKSNTTDKD